MAQKAIALYNEFCDLDFMDYTETQESDISFITALLETLGETDTRAFLTAYFD